MNTEELSKHLEAGDVRMIDIRESEELKEVPPIQGSEHIPMGRFFIEAGKGNISKDEKIVLICKSGGRCEVLKNEFCEKGFDVDYLEGGIGSWLNQDSK